MKKLFKDENFIVAAFFTAAVCLMCLFTLVFSGESVLSGFFRRYNPKEDDGIEARATSAVLSLEASFNDEVFARRYLASVGSNFEYLLTGDIISPQVFSGKDGWLFYKTVTDGNPMADYMGTDYYSEETLRRAAELVEASRLALEEKGIRFVILIAPNKEQIYDEYIEEARVSDVSRTDLLVEYLRANTKADIVYTKEELNDKAEENPLYYRYDTHWTNAGAYVSYRELMRTLGYELPELSKLGASTAPLEGYTVINEDLIKLAGLWLHNSDEKMCTPQGYRYTADGDEATSFIGVSDNPLTDSKVLVIGDSFRVSMIPLFERDFSESFIVHCNHFSPTTIDDFAPDVVVLEYAERYSADLASFSLLAK